MEVTIIELVEFTGIMELASIEAKEKENTMYNGHKNWNHWNVSLWINNDENLYGLARMAIEATKNKERAAVYMMEFLPRENTPDGAPYTKTSIRAAMREM